MKIATLSLLTLMTFSSLYSAEEAPQKKTQNGTNDTSLEISAHVYTLPGIVGIKGDAWIGSDNLFNLSKSIGVVAEIVKPTGKNLPTTPEAIRTQVAALLAEAGIESRSLGVGAEPPTPFFHMLIMVLPLEKGGYAVSCNGRLFEQIQNPRVTLEKGIFWQSITWEKQDLLYTTAEKLPDQLKLAIDRVVKSFTERFKFFEKIKEDSQPK